MKIDFTKRYIPRSYGFWVDGKTGKREHITIPLPCLIAEYHIKGDFPGYLITKVNYS